MSPHRKLSSYPPSDNNKQFTIKPSHSYRNHQNPVLILQQPQSIPALSVSLSIHGGSEFRAPATASPLPQILNPYQIPQQWRPQEYRRSQNQTVYRRRTVETDGRDISCTGGCFPRKTVAGGAAVSSLDGYAAINRRFRRCGAGHAAS